jgi:hypothetical protein
MRFGASCGDPLAGRDRVAELRKELERGPYLASESCDQDGQARAKDKSA